MSWKFSVQDFNTTIFGCFRKQWYPQIIHFNRVFHYKPSILGYLYFWKPPFASITILGGEKKQNKKTVLFENQVASGLTIMIVKTLPKSWVIPIMMPTITMTSATSIKALEKSRSHLFTKIYPCFFWGRREKGAWENFRVLSKDICLMSYCRRFMLWTNIKCIYLHVGFNFLFESTYTHLHTDDTYHTHTNIQLCRYMYIYFLYTYRIY